MAASIKFRPGATPLPGDAPLGAFKHSLGEQDPHINPNVIYDFSGC